MIYLININKFYLQKYKNLKNCYNYIYIYIYILKWHRYIYLSKKEKISYLNTKFTFIKSKKILVNFETLYSFVFLIINEYIKINIIFPKIINPVI